MPPRSATWDPGPGRYRDERRRTITGARVRRDLDAALREYGARAEALGRAFQRRAIGLARWEVEMRRLIKDVHVTAATVAKGGAAQMTPSDYGRVGARVRREYQYLARWARDVRAGRAPVTDALLARARLYAEGGRSTYEGVRARELAARGYDEERNVLHALESCTGPGSCVAETRRGWVPAGSLIPVGGRRCGPNCRCTVERRNSRTGRVAA